MLYGLLIIPVIIYSVFLLKLAYILWRKKQEKNPEGKSAGPLSSVSVVVACKNEEKNITVLLDSLVRQDYPENLFEIIIVDDHSTDHTADIISDFIRKNERFTLPKIILIKNASSGKKSAIYNGIRASSGELVMVTDADCTASSRWIVSHETVYRDENADMVSGRVKCTADKTVISSFGMYEFAALQGVTAAMTLAGEPVMCNGANMAFRKEAYLRNVEQIRMDIASGDDIFLLHAIKDSKGKVVWNNDTQAEIKTNGADTFAGLLRQRARWASKTAHYKDTATILTALAVFTCNICMAVLTIGSFFSSVFLIAFTAALVIKATADGTIIIQVLKKEKEKFSLLRFILMDILYPFYFILVFVLSFLPSMKRFSVR
jgi:poly-beta-1,6-N-acetyl-D-glucosamine synthase